MPNILEFFMRVKRYAKAILAAHMDATATAMQAEDAVSVHNNADAQDQQLDEKLFKLLAELAPHMNPSQRERWQKFEAQAKAVHSFGAQVIREAAVAIDTTLSHLRTVNGASEELNDDATKTLKLYQAERRFTTRQPLTLVGREN
jgi:hypothetical protein